ncbi:UNVERIFIED_CONTAM: hypothetical protein PYX00_002026 [Menopon gallinae]
MGATGHVDMEILGPDGSSVQCRVQRINNAKYRAVFTPITAGIHQITVFHNEQPINKQPFTVGVYNPAAVHILDLEQGFTNRATTFKVDSSEAGPGNLGVSIKAAGNPVKYSLRTVAEGLHEITFHPTIAVPHKIDVKYNGLHINGCPMELPVKNPAMGQDVLATGLGLYQARAGKPTSFVIETLGNSSKDFDVVITGPNSTAVPVRCYQQKDGNLLAEFTAQNSGVYKIEVSHGSRALRGSPYMCQVFDASKVKIQDVKKPVSLNIPTTLKIVRKGAGFAELDVAGDQPSRSRSSDPGESRTRQGNGSDRVHSDPARKLQVQNNIRRRGNFWFAIAADLRRHGTDQSVRRRNIIRSGRQSSVVPSERRQQTCCEDRRSGHVSSRDCGDGKAGRVPGDVRAEGGRCLRRAGHRERSGNSGLTFPSSHRGCQEGQSDRRMGKLVRLEREVRVGSAQHEENQFGRFRGRSRYSHGGMQRSGWRYSTDSGGDDLSFPSKGSSDAERSRRAYVIYELRRDTTSGVSITRIR